MGSEMCIRDSPEPEPNDVKYEKSVTRSVSKSRKPLSSVSANVDVGEDNASDELVPTKRARGTPKATMRAS